jgi:alkaline phosphatase D
MMKNTTIILFVLLLASCTRTSEKSIITHGPLLGRLGSESIGIWARTAIPGEFYVEYGTDPSRLDMKSSTVQTLLEKDNTAWILIEGLTPGTKYDYRLVPGSDAFHSGHFRTLPDDDMYRNDSLNPRGLFNFSFEFACGNNQNEGSGLGAELPAFRTILDHFTDEIHFSVQNGDWLYETDERGISADEWRLQTGTTAYDTPEVVKLAPTITGVWENYKGYLDRGKNLAEFHRYVPCFYTFDDHEILNDVIGCGQTGYSNRRTVFRDIAVQGWYDYLGWSNPIPFNQEILFGEGLLVDGEDVLFDANADFTKMDRNQQNNLHIHWGTETAGINETRYDSIAGDPNAGVYNIEEVLDPNRLKIFPPATASGKSSYSIGQHSYFRRKIGNCDFFFLDTRSSRMIHDHLNPQNPEKTMLGDDQLNWLLEGIENSDADFIFVVSSVNFMIPHLSGGDLIVSNKDDAWTAFQYERELLINTFDQSAAPVFILTGDLHNSFAIKITDNVWEFASGPRNSNNHNFTDEGSRPATGKFTYGNRTSDIRWSTYFLEDTPRPKLLHPTFCIVQINNVTNSPAEPNGIRFVAYERPQVIFRYYSGKTGDLLYAESITSQDI